MEIKNACLKTTKSMFLSMYFSIFSKYSFIFIQSFIIEKSNFISSPHFLDNRQTFFSKYATIFISFLTAAILFYNSSFFFLFFGSLFFFYFQKQDSFFLFPFILKAFFSLLWLNHIIVIAQFTRLLFLKQ